MEHFYKMINNKRKDKRGASSIEIMIGVMMFLLIFCFMMDLIVLTWKFNSISQLNTELARTMGIQGGVRTSAPHGFPGGNSTYYRSSDIISMSKDMLNNAWIADGKWWVRVNGNTLTNSSTFEFDYKNTFRTEVEIEYTWTYLSNFIPGSLTHRISSRRPAMSEWKYNYNSWIGE